MIKNNIWNHIRNIMLVTVLFAFATSSAFARLRVTTTTPDLASLVELIGGDRVEATSLSRPLQDAHYLDATPGMVVRISRSNMFVENGFELEMGWVPEVMRETRNRRVRRGGPGHVDASRGIRAIQIPERIHRDMGDVHPSGNPHYTLNPVTAQQAARNILDGLIRVDPDNQGEYLKNYQAYIEKSNELMEKWQKKYEPYKGEGIIIYHKHFDYIFDSLGVKAVEAIEPLPGLAPSPGHVAMILSSFNSDTVRLVLMEPWHDQRVGRQVAEGLGVPLVIGVPAVGAEQGADCILTMFDVNARRIYEALKSTVSR